MKFNIASFCYFTQIVWYVQMLLSIFRLALPLEQNKSSRIDLKVSLFLKQEEQNTSKQEVIGLWQINQS